MATVEKSTYFVQEELANKVNAELQTILTNIKNDHAKTVSLVIKRKSKEVYSNGRYYSKRWFLVQKKNVWYQSNDDLITIDMYPEAMQYNDELGLEIRGLDSNNVIISTLVKDLIKKIPTSGILTELKFAYIEKEYIG